MANQTGYLRHFQECNRYNLGHFKPFYTESQALGWVHTDSIATILSSHPSFQYINNQITLESTHSNFSSRSEALAMAAMHLALDRRIALRKEMYPLVAHYGDKPLAELDRAAVPWFGIPAFGVHVNGFVRKKDGLYLWIGERASNRRVDPGKLDNMIGGGQPIGLTMQQNLIKEAHEEAGLSPAVVANAALVRTIHYMLERPSGLRNDTIFIYDLELPEAITPQNTDGEVARFHLMSLQEVANLVASTDRFKFNCNLVIIDFLIRHAFIGPAHPEFDPILNYIQASDERGKSRMPLG